ncbi:hypothetical protein B0H16DRAFT_1032785 [Mycena metata]|uniref:Secreted protein n=1 Tax=Mycena metata TaxID=1033252 RepID=A0AAD7IEK0_9AGAR|nr:hypothetical protein B0H16DRAFT_1032785 [Mycena metata]
MVPLSWPRFPMVLFAVVVSPVQTLSSRELSQLPFLEDEMRAANDVFEVALSRVCLAKPRRSLTREEYHASCSRLEARNGRSSNPSRVVLFRIQIEAPTMTGFCQFGLHACEGQSK